MNFPLVGVIEGTLQAIVKNKSSDLLNFTEGDWDYEVTTQDEIKVLNKKLEGGLAYCDITGISNQCGMCVLSSINIYSPLAAKQLIKYADQVTKALGYTKIMATLVNEAKINHLKEAGFKEVDRFKNNRSKNTVVVLTKENFFEDKSL